ncbi:nicotinate-nucleotide adenylyltransferase [Sutcliffiella horikoshii]|uniref:Probable nicotinate-nucleotide adenylyltransferase n=1 Tax=Sutcliffiella horikoshii TaxID=79883 RepID=A0AA95B688_9BACI|nr:nicotinate-nucleotide adenylyltransferase [Sutcliffiella horikoshii]TYS59194.1 nicotinate-nucleotide adenylyltransferase [Sutcliffiella horikoshii]
MNKVGLIGGTFDPPHVGHLLIANDVRQKLSLDEIWFMPNHIPPHKQNKSVTPTPIRVKMIEAAVASNSCFRVETIELQREGPSYTYDTMMLLAKKYPDTRFYFIIGADMVEYLPKWHNIEKLLKIITFIGVKRPGYTFSSEYPVLEVETPQMDISSTLIRKRVQEGWTSQYLVPDKVKEIIEEKRLYE